MLTHKGYPEIYSKYLRPSEIIYLQRLFKPIYQHFPAQSKMLDAGCGDGRLAEIFFEKGCQVTAIDIEDYSDAWDRLKQKGMICLQASAEALPFANGTFDVVFIKDTFHHVENPKKAMKEIQRVTRRGGEIVVIEANRYNPIFYLHLTLFENHQHFSKKVFKRFLKEADEDYEYFMVESRCLPWDNKWILGFSEWLANRIEKAKIFNPWITYQIGIIKGTGKRTG